MERTIRHLTYEISMCQDRILYLKQMPNYETYSYIIDEISDLKDRIKSYRKARKILKEHQGETQSVSSQKSEEKDCSTCKWKNSKFEVACKDCYPNFKNYLQSDSLDRLDAG